MTTSLVTGANGFIGRHLIRALLERGDSVVGLVRATSDIRPLVPLFDAHGDRLRLAVGDLLDPESLAAPVSGVDYVFHLAAQLLGTQESDFQLSIVEGTRNLLAATEAHAGPELKRFLYTSSMAAAGPSHDGQPLREGEERHPVSWYGKAKSEAEVLVNAAGDRLPVTIVRPVAVYGEGELELARGTFPIVRMGFKPRVGMKASLASFVYVGDLVEGMIAAATTPAAVGRTYFLSDPQAYESGRLAEAIAEAMGKRARIPLITPVAVLKAGAVVSEWSHQFTRARPVTTRDKVRELRHKTWVASPAAAKEDLAWEAQTPLVEGLRRQVQDWDAKKRARRAMAGLSARDRAIQTYTLSVLVGIVLESLAKLGGWYEFSPHWLIFVVIFVVIGGIMGTVTYLTAFWPVWGQFLAGAAVGVGAELLNVWVFHAWTFNPDSFGLIPGDVLRAIFFGLPAGFMPVGVNAIVRSLYGRRLRLG